MDRVQPSLSPVPSEEYYAAVAAVYARSAAAQAPYLHGVDQFVQRWCADHAVGLILDLGCGDGRRLAGLAASTGASAVGVDNCERMVGIARANGIEARVADIAAPTWDTMAFGRYDLATCLWNVLGHIDSHESRVTALSNARSALADGGALIIDVNNRHNARAYGWARALRNVAQDAIGRGQRGDYPVVCRECSPPVTTLVHLFTPGEVKRMLHDAGLRPLQTMFIDYASGSPTGRWHGQILVAAVPDP